MQIDMPVSIINGMRDAFHNLHDEEIGKAFARVLKIHSREDTPDIENFLYGDIHVREYIKKSLSKFGENADIYINLCYLNNIVENSTFTFKYLSQLVKVDTYDQLGYVRGYVQFWDKVFT